MLPTSTPQQLLLIKQLYDDACILVAREDDLSLTKSLILLDLAVEQMLNQILRDFDGNFSPGRKDVFWQALWQQATPILKTMGSQLPNYRELSSLHAVRNLAQHNASIPTQSEVKRYVKPVGEMLSGVFKDAYKIDFANFTLWELIENEGLRHWLQDSDSASEMEQSEIAIAGCKVAHELVISAIRKRSRPESFHRSLSSGLGRGLPSRLTSHLEYIEVEIKFLENEVVALGMGMPLMDTREFRKAGQNVQVFRAVSGDIQIVKTGPIADREELAGGARFMLNYMSRMIRLVYETYPGLIDTIEVKKPLREQQIWKNIQDRNAMETSSM